MSNYLSQFNKNILDSIIPILKRNLTNEIKLNVNDPTKLEYIVRGAYKKKEYRWIKDTFIISSDKENNKLIFKPRQLSISVEEKIENTPSIIEAGDFFEIINILISKTHSLYIFHCSLITETELEAIDEWCKVNSYSQAFDNNSCILTISAIKK